MPGLRICLQRREEQLHQPLKSGKMCMSKFERVGGHEVQARDQDKSVIRGNEVTSARDAV